MSQIVVGMDRSEGSAAALRWALSEGDLRGWPITAVFSWGAVVDYEPPIAGSYDFEQAQKICEEIVADAVTAAVGGRASDVAQVATIEPPTSALVGRAGPDDLLVVGARGVGGFRGLLLGSVSNHCLHLARSPAVVVRRGTEHPPRAPERIVIGVDGSPSSDAALRWAVDAARTHGATIEAVHAWHLGVVGALHAAVALDTGTLPAAARRALDAAIDAEDTHGVPVVRTVVCNNPAAAILDAARDADLVVVGSRGLGDLKGLLLGSVSHQVVHHAACPVAVIRATT